MSTLTIRKSELLTGVYAEIVWDPQNSDASPVNTGNVTRANGEIFSLAVIPQKNPWPAYIVVAIALGDTNGGPPDAVALSLTLRQGLHPRLKGASYQSIYSGGKYVIASLPDTDCGFSIKLS